MPLGGMGSQFVGIAMSSDYFWNMSGFFFCVLRQVRNPVRPPDPLGYIFPNFRSVFLASFGVRQLGKL